MKRAGNRRFRPSSQALLSEALSGARFQALSGTAAWDAFKIRKARYPCPDGGLPLTRS
jgi:hypothetical protein